MKQIRIILICCCLANIWGACTDDLDNISKQNRKGLVFSTTMIDWNQQDITTRGNGVHTLFGRVSTPIPGSEFSLITTIGEGVEPRNTLSLNGDTTATTRGVEKSSFINTDQFKMSAFYTKNDGTEVTYIDAATATFKESKNGVNYWQLSDEKYWQLVNRSIEFYAWWPSTLTFNNSTKTINYTVSTNVTTQPDFLYAAPEPTYYLVENPADLQFKHALTAVRFVVSGGVSGTITNLQLKNIAYTGTFNLKTGNWSPDYTKITNDFSINPNTPISAGSNAILNTGTNVFYMLPQDLTRNGARVEFTVGGNSYAANLTGIKTSSGTGSDDPMVWKPGVTVTYTLSKSEGEGYVLYATSTDASYDAKTLPTVSVMSYKLNSDNSTQRIPWKITGYSIDNGDYFNAESSANWRDMNNTKSIARWIKTGTYSGTSDSEDGRTFKTITLQMNKADVSRYDGKGEEINSYLKSQSIVGSASNRRDLSLYDARGNSISQTTSNCYIVRAAGYYKIPAAYGNAIVNNKTVSNAYNYSDFQNYLGNVPTSPWILTDTGTSASNVEAKLVWYEGAITGAITDVTYTDNYITFNVNKSKIYQGNAVIGLYDKVRNVYMWSWHIWITNAYGANGLYPDTQLTANGSTYKMSPEWIGAILGGRRSIYDSRSVLLRIEQMDEDGTKQAGYSTSKVFVIHGSGVEDNRFVGCTYYQWGRKDPIPCPYNPALTNGQSGLRDNNYAISMPADFPDQWYSDGNWRNVANLKISIAESINHPERMKIRNSDNATNRGSWVTTHLLNFWNATATQMNLNRDAVTKSIYDPCPTGYHLPYTYFYDDAYDKTRSYWEEVRNPANNALLYRVAHVALKDGSGFVDYYPTGFHNWANTGFNCLPTYNNGMIRAWSSGATGYEAGYVFRGQADGGFELTAGDYSAHGMCCRPVHD